MLQKITGDNETDVPKQEEEIKELERNQNFSIEWKLISGSAVHYKKCVVTWYIFLSVYFC